MMFNDLSVWPKAPHKALAVLTLLLLTSCVFAASVPVQTETRRLQSIDRDPTLTSAWLVRAPPIFRRVRPPYDR